MREWFGLKTVWEAVRARRRADRRRQEVIALRAQRDAEQAKLSITTVIAPDRASTLLATGDRILVDPRDRGCGALLMHQGRYEETELRLFRAHLAPTSVVLDVGANYGYYSLCSAPFVRPAGRVLAFEPNPHVRRLLELSLQLNAYDGVVEAIGVAASDVADRLCFVVDETGPGGAHVEHPAMPAPPDWQRLEVPVAPLDELLPADLTVDLVKLDVEGHEARALAGMRAIIRRSPRIMVFMEFIYDFLVDEAAFRHLCRLITDDLGLRANRLLPDGSTVEVDPTTLAGVSCTLVLSKVPMAPVPDVTVHAVHLSPASGAALVDGDLVWRRAPATPARQTICLGGFLYLPRGLYRLAVSGRFDGPFLLRIGSQGETLWDGRVEAGDFTRRIDLAVDAPRLEVVLIALGPRSRSARFTSLAFWRL